MASSRCQTCCDSRSDSEDIGRFIRGRLGIVTVTLFFHSEPNPEPDGGVPSQRQSNTERSDTPHHAIFPSFAPISHQKGSMRIVSRANFPTNGNV